ncbi:histidine kinase [Glycomyces sp. NPDC046736]|uniref:sensor histidine kinase n=1 Tax=Glycomyces sp. NPDC046736 TaxID=3155615 RepID=UPI0033C38A73
MKDLRPIPRSWRRLDVAVRDLLLGLLLAALSFLPALRGHETQVGDLPPRPFDAVAALALVLLCLPIALRRRMPATSLALVSLGFAVASLGQYHLGASTALPIAVLSAGVHLERLRRTAIAVLTASYVGLAFGLARLGSTEGLEGFATFYLLLAVIWGIGARVRAGRIAEAGRREALAATTRAAERARIARELHDVVTHHVTAMVVQAEAARYLTAAPDRLDRALAAVGETGRKATTDLRHLLDLLDAGEDSGPEARSPLAGRFLTLVEQARRSGQPVAFVQEGEPSPTGGSADLVAYRVVQEALTNALKHARGADTSVLVRHGTTAITVDVATASAVPREQETGGGRGLAGLRERVDLLGGEFSAGPENGGFAVRARVPAQGAS